MGVLQELLFIIAGWIYTYRGSKIAKRHCSLPWMTSNIKIMCMVWESKLRCTKISIKACSVLDNIVSNIVFFAHCACNVASRLKYYDIQSFVNSKVQTIEQSFPDIHEYWEKPYWKSWEGWISV